MSSKSSEKPHLGIYSPTLILHGGAGGITRKNLPPELYSQYRTSLQSYVEDTHAKLESGSTALDAACHAVSLMEDDPLFNCGRGSVFTEAGTIEMEASVMVASVSGTSFEGEVKRGAAVSMLRETRHPILLAKELLLDAGNGLGGTASMHCHLSGPGVEEWGWEKKGLERKGHDWFWTKKRWDEHLRGLKSERDGTAGGGKMEGSLLEDVEIELPSQGTVGAVCLDSWGNLAVATSTGGLTNKKSGRIGDTPTLGAGFWAESWAEKDDEVVNNKEADGSHRRLQLQQYLASPKNFPQLLTVLIPDAINDCISFRPPQSAYQHFLFDHDSQPKCSRMTRQSQQQLTETKHPIVSYAPPPLRKNPMDCQARKSPANKSRLHAVAMSGTGNGDSFLRTCAVRSAALLCKISPHAGKTSHSRLGGAISCVAGPGGDLQRSAGDRWGKTGEGQGGIIGIEVVGADEGETGKGIVVADFNCGGLWRAWIDEKSGRGRVRVFKGEYEDEPEVRVAWFSEKN